MPTRGWFRFTRDFPNTQSIAEQDGARVRPSVDRNVSVCALLTSKEIEAVQGEPVKETRSTLQVARGMNLLQCVFHRPTAAKSVSLEVATVNHSNLSAATPRKFWRNQFHASDLKEEELPTDAKPVKGLMIEPQNDERKPRRIGEVGEEAYWVGNQSHHGNTVRAPGRRFPAPQRWRYTQRICSSGEIEGAGARCHPEALILEAPAGLGIGITPKRLCASMITR